jgi:hypothetical protein
MNIEKLIHWLSSHHIEILEDRTRADGSRIITFTTALPYGELDGRHVWYPIVLFKDQTEVSRSEIEACCAIFGMANWKSPTICPPYSPVLSHGGQ